MQVIKRAGVEKAIKDADIRALFNHDDSLVLGRTGNGTLTLAVDDVGLFGDIIINKDDPQAVGAYARVKRGDVIGCSFGFIPIKNRNRGALLLCFKTQPALLQKHFIIATEKTSFSFVQSTVLSPNVERTSTTRLPTVVIS